MKYRTDFVTNSSSSSFIVARKEEFTPEQKEEIVKFFEEQGYVLKSSWHSLVDSDVVCGDDIVVFKSFVFGKQK